LEKLRIDSIVMYKDPARSVEVEKPFEGLEKEISEGTMPLSIKQ
jgi:hypothetical protein